MPSRDGAIDRLPMLNLAAAVCVLALTAAALYLALVRFDRLV